MRRWLEDRNRRAILIFAAATLLYLLVSEVVLPVYDSNRPSSTDINIRVEELRKLRQVVGRRGQYETLLAETDKRVKALESRLLDGPNSVRASGELQAMVEESARKAGITLTQRSVVATVKKEKFLNEVGFTVNFESNPAQLMNFFSELRNTPKSLKLSSAQITPVQPVTEPPANADVTKNLRVNLTIISFFADPAVTSGGPKS